MKVITRIPSTPKRLNILSSVIGQMSDGIWENSTSMRKYWQSLDYEVNAEGFIEIIDRHFVCSNPCKFLADKIKQVIKIEIEDGNSELEWSRSCAACPDYMRGGVTVGDCYELYELLKGRATERNTYATYNTYNVVLTYEDAVINMQVDALNELSAKRKAVELLAKKIKATVTLA